ncbi:hypothetical protein NHP190012_04870 [Helicobacter sp. NHP19-012]|uniref:Uncharacterized protein n=1 Tax=Helicobacter gastrofelis TaxID=2849642 RepID=A0ABM7SL34_9HELI|nr:MULTISPECIES: hypothetical protein [unclassified Helicobacter]BCZ18845.1 hypothetical protein NHP190012_04870 [Helicobacter sp. NHP19-012]GMB96256.1 hypothetical protein NHP22001_08450 [Helicobacter sp. NHP22-001]
MGLCELARQDLDYILKGVDKIKVISPHAGEVTIYYTAKEGLDAPKYKGL